VAYGSVADGNGAESEQWGVGGEDRNAVDGC